MSSVPSFDVLGIGLNATDTVILLDRFPAYAGKVPFTREFVSVGGQVASAMVACARLGMRVKYIGTCGDDERGQIQMQSLRESGIDISDVQVKENCPNQTAYILIDKSTGERTVLWQRADCLALSPDDIRPEMITQARLVHIDGHDTAAVGKAAAIARQHGIPVTVDVDTIYHGFEEVLPNVDYLITSSEFPTAWTGQADPLKALATIQKEFAMRVAAMTLGAHGAIARVDGQYVYSPAYVVNCIDTTGAGDVFHGAFCYAVLAGLPMKETLDLANALAALNCTALGARGRLATLAEAQELMKKAERRHHPDYQRFEA
ncbi:MAG: ribokinase [Bryobacteraceae bacterium]|nr:ribokinase [Bryobacteraceae bacterium]